MLDRIRRRVDHLLKEKLPIMAVDALIDGTRMAKKVTDRTAHLISDGTLMAPGWLVDRAREYIRTQEEMYRVLEPDEDWESRPLEEEAASDVTAEPAPAPPSAKAPSPKKKKPPRTTPDRLTEERRMARARAKAQAKKTEARIRRKTSETTRKGSSGRKKSADSSGPVEDK